MQLPNPLLSKRSAWSARLTAITDASDEMSGVCAAIVDVWVVHGEEHDAPEPPRPVVAALLMAVSTTVVVGVPMG